MFLTHTDYPMLTHIVEVIHDRMDDNDYCYSEEDQRVFGKLERIVGALAAEDAKVLVLNTTDVTNGDSM